MSCPYKWHSRRSLLMFLHSSISKNDFHVLTKSQSANEVSTMNARNSSVFLIATCS